MMLLSQPMTAPGREGSASAPTQTALPSAPPPSEGPRGGPAGFEGILPLLLPVVVIFVVMSFMRRNETKRQKTLESSLKVGDRVVMQSGILGKLVELGERTAKLDVAPGVTIQVLKTSISGVDATDKAGKESKPPEKK